MLSEQVDIARVEPLGLVEIRLASVPLTAPPRDRGQQRRNLAAVRQELTCLLKVTHSGDRKSTRLNSSHSQISYAVFCLKKKKKHMNELDTLLLSLRAAK